jgi:UDP-glucose 4-epimerase
MQNLRQGMVSIYLAQLLKSETIIVKGSLDRFRDFIFINDCIDLVVEIIANEKTVGRIYNVGTGVRTTVKGLLEKVMTIAGIEKPIVAEDVTPGDQKGIFADIALAQNELDFTPGYSLDEGLEKMITWAKLSMK